MVSEDAAKGDGPTPGGGGNILRAMMGGKAKPKQETTKAEP